VHFHAALYNNDEYNYVGIVISSKSLHSILVSSRARPIQKVTNGLIADTGFMRNHHFNDECIFYVNITPRSQNSCCISHCYGVSTETFSSRSIGTVTRTPHALLRRYGCVNNTRITRCNRFNSQVVAAAESLSIRRLAPHFGYPPQYSRPALPLPRYGYTVAMHGSTVAVV
jgi:hypothetical protein